MRRLIGFAMLGLFAAAAAGWAQTPQNPQQELAKLENAWKQAVVNRDKASLERLYTADYTSTDTEGMDVSGESFGDLLLGMGQVEPALVSLDHRFIEHLHRSGSRPPTPGPCVRLLSSKAPRTAIG